jgi:hypothetical protein
VPSFPNISHNKQPASVTLITPPAKADRSYKRKTFWKEEYSGLVAPSEVCCERYLEYLWDEKKLERHVSRIIHAQARVDCKPPLLTAKTFFNSQGLKKTERRMRQHEKQNQELVRRIGIATSTKRRNRIECWNDLYLIRSDPTPEKKLRARQLKNANVVLLERIMAVSTLGIQIPVSVCLSGIFSAPSLHSQ